MIQVWVPQDMGNKISPHRNQAMVWAIEGSISIKVFLSSKTPRPALGPTQPHCSVDAGGSFPRDKAGRE